MTITSDRLAQLHLALMHANNDVVGRKSSHEAISDAMAFLEELDPTIMDIADSMHASIYCEDVSLEPFEARLRQILNPGAAT